MGEKKEETKPATKAANPDGQTDQKKNGSIKEGIFTESYILYKAGQKGSRYIDKIEVKRLN